MVKSKTVPVLGYFVWWSVESIDEERDHFDELCQQNDFETIKRNNRTAFLEAVRYVKAKSWTNHVLIRTIEKSKEQHLFGLVDEKVDQKSKSLGYEHKATLRFDQASHQIECDVKHRAFDLIRDRYDHNLKYINSYEMRRWIMKQIERWRNVSVRDKGGIYYVDAKYETNLERLERLLQQVGGVDFFTVPLQDVEKSKKAIYKAFVEDLRHKLEVFKDQIENDKFSTAKGWSNAVEKFRALREEVSFYAERLEFNAKSLQKELEKLQADVRKKLVD